MVIAITLQYCAQRLTTTKYDTKVFSYISNCIGSDRVSFHLFEIKQLIKDFCEINIMFFMSTMKKN